MTPCASLIFTAIRRIEDFHSKLSFILAQEKGRLVAQTPFLLRQPTLTGDLRRNLCTGGLISQPVSLMVRAYRGSRELEPDRTRCLPSRRWFINGDGARRASTP